MKYGLLLIAFLAFGCAEESGPRLSEQSVESLSIPERRDRFDERANENVEYYNPKTGYSADYTLDVEYASDGTAERVNFPNGGWEDDFVDQRENGDGTVTVTDEDGREFTVPKMDDPEEDVIDRGDEN